VARHEPVLLAECLEALAVRPGGFYVDGTLGLGGHARAILEASAPTGTLLGADRDSEALAEARAALAPFGERARLEHAEFSSVPGLLGDARPDGILLDLGVSSLQLDSAERGFSFQQDGPLDMRMDRTRPGTAAEAVNRLPEPRLADILHELGEEPAARRVARAIVAARRARRLATTAELAAVVRRAAHRRPGLDPATRTFQALRIHVNRELEGLGDTLGRLARCLAPQGRLAVISFHSLEDRAVKRAFRALDGDGFGLVTRKPVRPAAAEVARNPRARSAKLRAIARTPEAA
jgi:16S rRNA (cytosine1402-N4)-methyltransferase